MAIAMLRVYLDNRMLGKLYCRKDQATALRTCSEEACVDGSAIGPSHLDIYNPFDYQT
jgi:hypothetical protein